MDEIMQPVVENDAEAERRKANATARKQKQRAKDKAVEEAGLSDEEKEAAILSRWSSNIKRLPAAEREQLQRKFASWNFIVWDCCHQGSIDIGDSVRIGAPVYGGTFFPERLFAEVEAYARAHPSVDEPHDAPDYKRYGLFTDGIQRICYDSLIAAFARWYKINRQTLILSTDPATDDEYPNPYIRTWEQVDALVAANKALALQVKQ